MRVVVLLLSVTKRSLSAVTGPTVLNMTANAKHYHNLRSDNNTYDQTICPCLRVFISTHRLVHSRNDQHQQLR